MPMTKSDVEISLLNITAAVQGGKVVAGMADARFAIAVYDSSGTKVATRTGRIEQVQLDPKSFKFTPSQLTKIRDAVRTEIAGKEVQAANDGKSKITF